MEEMTSPVSPTPALPFARAISFILGRRVSADVLRGGRDLSLLAMLLLLGVYVGRDGWFAEPERYFSSWGFAPYFTELFLIGAFAYVMSRSAHCMLPLGILLSVLLEVYFFLMLLLNGLAMVLYHYDIDQNGRYYMIFSCAWITLSVQAVLMSAFQANFFRTMASAVCFTLMLLAAQYQLDYASHQFWYHDYADDESESESDKITDYEQVFFSQEGLLEKQIDRLVPGVEGQIDMFYLGFGSYADQAVFKKEVTYIKKLLDQKGISQGRGVVLVNHYDTWKEYPLAIQHNLDNALQGIAQKMNPDEDILFLYVTSHGSEDHELSVSFPPFRFRDLTPALLRQALDDSGIRWKVIIISACYSGGFIELLKDPYSLIATAADANNKSFGCSNENEFTYFGQALFRDQLAKDVPLLEALPRAIEAIGEREKREKKTPSNPQLWMQEPVAEHLRQFEAQGHVIESH